MVAPVLDPRSDSDLDAAIATGHAEMCAMHRRLLADVAEHDRREAWRAHGTTSETKFLESNLGVSWRTASAWVRVGHALDRRPALGEHLADGTFSFDHVLGLVDVMAAEEASAVSPLGPFDDQAPSGSDSPDPSDGLAPEGPDPADPSATGEDGPRGRDPAGGEDPGSGPQGGALGGGGLGGGALGGGALGGGALGGSALGGGDGLSGRSDAELLDLASRMTPAQLASSARRMRQRSADEAAAAHRRRRVSAWLDNDSGQLRLHGGLFEMQAQNVWAALIDFATGCTADPVSGKFDPLEVRFADALDAMATAYLEGRSHVTHRPAVVVHADSSILDGEDGWAHTSTGTPIASETVRRLLCFCDLTTVINDGLGDPLRLGRTKRTPTWQLAEMVRRRDGGCRFPGCQRTLWVQTHHVRQWDRDLGPTDYENLADLCSYHHHLVHEGRWRLEGDPCGELVFVDPSGTIRLSSWPNLARTAKPPGDPPPESRPPGAAPPTADPNLFGSLLASVS